MPVTTNHIANRERILRDFTDIVNIDSPSLKERKIAEALREKLVSIGFAVYEDNAGAVAGGECGNLIAALPAYASSGAGDASEIAGNAGGGAAELPVVAMLAHMDTVGPCENKRCIVDGDIVRSDGKTILGGDDGAGIVAALEIARRVKEEGIRHGGILIIYTIAEETGLDGAKNLDRNIIKTATGSAEFPRFCFVFDSGGAPGSVVARAPSHTDMIISVKGVAAHSGIEPEKGVNAIAALSDAIAHMRLGRIDADTTANIGIIRGGLARNIVCESASAEGEARSHNPDTLKRQTAHMKECVAEACSRRGASFDFQEITSYNAFSLTREDEIIRLLSGAAKARGYELNPVPSGGGSDANILNAMGVPAANLPVGMHEVHSTKEYTDLRETAETIELIVAAFRLLAAGPPYDK